MRGWKAILGYGIAVACLVWLFYDLDWSRLAADMAGIHWGWVALAIVFDVLSYLCQGWRWELLLRPLGKLSAARTTQAIFAGLFTNEILPMRVGEILRVYLVSRWLRVKFSDVIPSLVVERFFDGIWLAVCIAITAMFIALPANLLRAADILGAAMLAGTGVFAYIAFRGRETPAEPRTAAKSRLFGALSRLFAQLRSGLRDIGRSRAVYVSLAVSLLFLLGQILAFWLIMWAYGLKMSFWIGTAVLLIVHLGTAIPNAPANVGTYQFFTVLGLELFGVGKTVAAGFSLVVFFLLTVPLWVVGSFALSSSGMTITSVRREIGRISADRSAGHSGQEKTEYL